MKRTLIFGAIALCLSIVPISAKAATITGEFWDASDPLLTLQDALNIAENQEATATFMSSGIDYPLGDANTVPDTTTLAEYLGADAATLSGPGDVTLEQSVFRFTGQIALDDAPTLFSVGSDDGFVLSIGNGAADIEFAGLRSFGTTSLTMNLGEGLFDFELIYFENQGGTGVEFEINGETVTGAEGPTVVPISASGYVLLSALGLLGLMRLRSRA